jgi:hypothetical protein
MDSLGGGIANADLSKLSDRDKQELQQFAMNEGQKARIQSCMFWFLFLFTSHHITLGSPLFSIMSRSPGCLFSSTPTFQIKRARHVTIS